MNFKLSLSLSLLLSLFSKHFPSKNYPKHPLHYLLLDWQILFAKPIHTFPGKISFSQPAKYLGFLKISRYVQRRRRRREKDTRDGFSVRYKNTGRSRGKRRRARIGRGWKTELVECRCVLRRLLADIIPGDTDKPNVCSDNYAMLGEPLSTEKVATDAVLYHEILTL